MNKKCEIIMQEYRDNKEVFQQIEKIVKEKINVIIKTNNFNIMSVESRIKEEKSLEGKLNLKGDKYDALVDITDILGLRIITFFEDTVDEVAKVIEQEFIIDYENSVDKRALLDPDTFGYLSLHYICSIKGDYPEELLNKRFEIQIRSILQHTWSAIYHDLGYKTSVAVPREIKRNFARIAGLLELADNEFVEIREDLASYAKQVEEKTATGDVQDLSLNAVTLDAYMKQSFMQQLLAQLNAPTIYDAPDEDYLRLLQLLDIQQMDQLQAFIEKYKEQGLAYAKYVAEEEVPNTLILKGCIYSSISSKSEEEVEEILYKGYLDKKIAKKQTKELFKAMKKMRKDAE
ncbi:MAG: hypothetical protein HUJ56_02640 [Erysipelotrichaceae bacterium]|nr:hypothetical protein [Erysipelotrichaceae bacterium]